MSLQRHAAANLIGAVAPMVVGLLTVPLYLKHIGVERFGVLALVWTVLAYFGFLDLGLGRAVTQRISQLHEAKSVEVSDLLWTAVSATLVLGTLGGLALWIGAQAIFNARPTVSADIAAELMPATIWMAAALPALLSSSALGGALQARLRFFELNTIQVSTGLVGQVLPLGLAMFGHTSLSELIPAALIGRVLAVFLLVQQCRRHVPLLGRPTFIWSHLRPMLGYGGWMSALTVLGALLVTTDRFLIASLAGVRAVAQYTVPYDLVTRLMVVSGSLGGALFPRVAAADEQEGRALAIRSSATLTAVVTLLVVATMLAVGPFLSVWLGAEFAQAACGVPELILLGVWLNAVVIPHHTRFLARESPRSVVVVLLLELPVYFALLWYATVHWGIQGAAAAWSFRILMDTILLLRLNRTLKVTVRASALSGLFVLCALILALSNLSVIWKLFLAILLVFSSALLDRDLLVATVSSRGIRKLRS